MSVREYIGARYVPVFADPIQWDPTLVYEPLTVVTDQGASYVSRRMVPEGIQLDNTEYWVLWADFNAQLQHYIDEVETFDGRIDNLEDALPIADYSSASTVSDAISANANDISTINTTIGDASSGMIKDISDNADAIVTANNHISSIEDALPIADYSSLNTVSDAISANASAISALQSMQKSDAYMTDGTQGHSYFIGGITGSDDNGGTGDSDMLKTIDKAFELARKAGYSAVNLRIRENGTYSLDDLAVQNAQLHITPASTTTNVTVEVRNLVYLYNSYIHLSAAVGTTFTLRTPAGLHMDGCSLYAEKVVFDCGTRFDLNMSHAIFDGCTLSMTNLTIRPISSTLRFLTSTKIETNIKYMLYAQNCMIEWIGTLTILNTASDAGGMGIRFDECAVMIQTNGATITTANTWDNFFGFLRSFVTVDSSTQTAVQAHATNISTGSYSYVKANSTNVIG